MIFKDSWGQGGPGPQGPLDPLLVRGSSRAQRGLEILECVPMKKFKKATPENRGFQKMEIQFFLHKIIALLTSFGKKLLTLYSLGEYKNVKTCGQCSYVFEGKT